MSSQIACYTKVLIKTVQNNGGQLLGAQGVVTAEDSQTGLGQTPQTPPSSLPFLFIHT